jgi:amino-acid N-acetyltransferase
MSSAAASANSQGPDVTIRAATPADLPHVRGLLCQADLPIDGVPEDLAHFFVAQREDAVVGAIGLEHYNTSALLRSAVVHPSLRGTGVGESLVSALLEHGRALGVRDMVLLTTTAEGWFPRFGFTRIARDEIPSALNASEELKGACPASAVAMRCVLDARRKT